MVCAFTDNRPNRQKPHSMGQAESEITFPMSVAQLACFSIRVGFDGDCNRRRPWQRSAEDNTGVVRFSLRRNMSNNREVSHEDTKAQ